jgi:hypothetical protein
MRELRLENSDKVAFVDDADHSQLASIKWHLNKKTGYVYGYLSNKLRPLLHRFIMGITDPKVQVDHENRNPLDCTRGNLRLCTNRENTGNSKKRTTNTSGYKGVSWSRKYGKWRATITDNGRHQHVGYFDCLVVAARAYDREATRVFGKFAGLNFPNEDNRNFEDGIARKGEPTSLCPGIHRNKHGRWIVKTKSDGDWQYIGSFSSEEEAIAATKGAN